MSCFFINSNYRLMMVKVKVKKKPQKLRRIYSSWTWKKAIKWNWSICQLCQLSTVAALIYPMVNGNEPGKNAPPQKKSSHSWLKLLAIDFSSVTSKTVPNSSSCSRKKNLFFHIVIDVSRKTLEANSDATQIRWWYKAKRIAGADPTQSNFYNSRSDAKNIFIS